jgi:hypothetical protein
MITILLFVTLYVLYTNLCLLRGPSYHGIATHVAQIAGSQTSKNNLTGCGFSSLLKCEGRLLPPSGTESPVTPPCRTHDMAARHLAIPCDDTRNVLYRAGLWRDATTPLVGIGRYKISEGTSAERIPNTSFSKQVHRYGAVYQLSHVGPRGTPLDTNWMRTGGQTSDRPG